MAILLAKYKATLAGILAVSLCLNLLGLVVPRLTQAILDGVFPHGDLSLLGQLLLILVLVTGLQIVLTVWRRLTLVRMSLAIDRVVLTEFLAHVLSLPSAFFRKQATGDLVARWGDHGHVRHLLAGGLTRVVIDALMVVIYLGVMFAYSAHLALLVVILLATFATFVLLKTPALRRQHRQLLDDKGTQEAHLTEMITGIDVIKALSLEQFHCANWHACLETYLERNYRAQKLRQLLESAGTALQYVCLATLLWFGSMLVVNGQMTVGALLAFSMYSGQAVAPLLSLITLWDEAQLARGALERIEEIRRLEPDPKMAGGLCQPLHGHVQFENVWFGYGDSDSMPVLCGISLAAARGECLALVGASGSGKTTLVRLLLGLCRPSQGHVLIDGKDLAQLDLEAYRQQLGVVLQENVLFSGSVLSNIAVGDLKPDAQRATHAAHQAGAHDFIMTLPGGYQARVEERGTTLSGGQRQRIALARALYRNPRILVLDEPLSAVDNSCAQHIWQTILAEKAERTIFLVTHDMNLARAADAVLFLDAGRISTQLLDTAFDGTSPAQRISKR